MRLKRTELLLTRQNLWLCSNEWCQFESHTAIWSYQSVTLNTWTTVNAFATNYSYYVSFLSRALTNPWLVWMNSNKQQVHFALRLMLQVCIFALNLLLFLAVLYRHFRPGSSQCGNEMDVCIESFELWLLETKAASIRHELQLDINLSRAGLGRRLSLGLLSQILPFCKNLQGRILLS